jgi:hypothetical protein
MTAETIARLNDAFRKTGAGGRMLMTAGVQRLSERDRAEIVQKIRLYDQFTAANDPYGEHDFGSLEQGGQKIFFKIDYYDPSYEYGSEDPADPEQTERVLTIMLAHEY